MKQSLCLDTQERVSSYMSIYTCAHVDMFMFVCTYQFKFMDVGYGVYVHTPIMYVFEMMKRL